MLKNNSPLYFFAAPLILFLLYSSSFSQQLGWIGLGNESVAQKSISVTPEDESSLEVTFELPGFSADMVRSNNQAWQTLTYSDQCYSTELGAPDLPLSREYVAVPEGAELTVEVLDVTFETLENYTVKPRQADLVENEIEEQKAFQYNQSVYTRDALYPNVWAKVSKEVFLGNVCLKMLEINPLRYNPVTKQLLAASKITCKVAINKKSGGTVNTYPSHLKNVYKALAINFEHMDYKAVPFRAQSRGSKATDYFFLVDSRLENNNDFQKLVNFHKSCGINVEVKRASSMSSTEVRNAIRSAYNDGELDYVLLVGDLPAIPHISGSAPGDSKYACLKGSDKIGDIGLGRLPATNATELEYMVTKTIDFMTGAEPGEWRKKTCLIAHREQYPNKYTKCCNEIYRASYSLGKPIMDKIYGGEGKKNSDVTRAINSGRIVVNYRGHGSRTAWTGWCRSSFTTSSITSLNNGKKTPVVFSMACTNGDMSRSGHCLAEAFMCQKQGAVAILAATKPSYTTVNHTYDKALYKAVWDQGISDYGSLRLYADSRAIRSHGNSTGGKNVEMYVLFSDPLVDIRKTINNTGIHSDAKQVSLAANMKYQGSKIVFNVPKTSAQQNVTIKLYNAQGKSVYTLANGLYAAGMHSVSLNSAEVNGRGIASGMYLCKMRMKGVSKTLNIIINK